MTGSPQPGAGTRQTGIQLKLLRLSRRGLFGAAAALLSVGVLTGLVATRVVFSELSAELEKRLVDKGTLLVGSYGIALQGPVEENAFGNASLAGFYASLGLSLGWAP